MGKTYRRDTKSGTIPRREPYKKRNKNGSLDQYKGYSSADIEEEFEEDEDEDY